MNPKEIWYISKSHISLENLFTKLKTHAFNVCSQVALNIQSSMIITAKLKAISSPHK